MEGYKEMLGILKKGGRFWEKMSAFGFLEVVNMMSICS